MFRNKIMVRADPPFSSSSSPFLLRQLVLSDPSSPPSPSHSIKLETLCCKLSRRWRVACFPQSSEICIVYQRVQSESASRVVKELIETLPISNVEVEEEVQSSSLIAKAVECALRSIMLDSNWRCVGENCFVDSTFACSEERSHLHALNVRVQSETSGGFVFLVSPDVLWFSRHKITNLVSAKMLQRFANGEEVILEDCNFSTSCTILPSLYEGHVIGLQKLLPAREDFERMEELWSVKHGLSLPSDYYINIELTFGGHANKQWFPSAFILQGSGLAPAPQTIRTSKAVHALEAFIKIVGAWDFFDRGKLKTKGISSLSIGTNLPVWRKAKSTGVNCIAGDGSSLNTNDTIITTVKISKDLLVLDFRTPKPALGCDNGIRKLDHTEIQENPQPSSRIILNSTAPCIDNGVPINTITKSIPLFMGLAPVKGSILSDNTVDQPALPPVPKRRRVDHTDIVIPSWAELGLVPKRLFFEKKHSSAKACTGDLKSQEDVSMQRDGGNLKSSPKALRKKGKALAILDNNCLADPRKVHLEALGKRTLNNEENKDDIKEGLKKSSKQNIDSSDMIVKVINYHKRGELRSLTVADLKCFLASKKAKVGGKKEDLIQRIISLLT